MFSLISSLQIEDLFEKPVFTCECTYESCLLLRHFIFSAARRLTFNLRLSNRLLIFFDHLCGSFPQRCVSKPHCMKGQNQQDRVDSGAQILVFRE